MVFRNLFKASKIDNLSEQTIHLSGINPVDFYGVNNGKLKILQKAFPRLKVVSRGEKIKINGNEEDIAEFKDKVDQITRFISRYGEMSMDKIIDLLEGIKLEGMEEESKKLDVLVYGPHGKMIRAKTANQKRMVETSEHNDVLFAIGPAGTGKTYTAVAIAVKALKAKAVRKIILTRPAVEAGENLGFLPGDLKDKIDPYLRPLYDALDDMIPLDKLNYFMTNRVIEIAPLAFMRGRTLDNAFIILDEAQNATSAQLKMFLTRLGPSAKCIITGDLTQIDLPRNQKSGLSKSIQILKDIKGIGMVFLNKGDVIRHRLVKHIIEAYEIDTEETKARKEAEKENRD